MKSKRFTDEQLIAALKESEVGAKTKELCRRQGISEETFYNWKAKFGGMTVSEASGLLAPCSVVVFAAGFADSGFGGATAEDRFFGCSDPGGILSIHIWNDSGGMEVDHLKYGQLAVVPVPAVGWLLGPVLGVLILLRRSASACALKRAP